MMKTKVRLEMKCTSTVSAVIARYEESEKHPEIRQCVWFSGGRYAHLIYAWNYYDEATQEEVYVLDGVSPKALT